MVAATAANDEMSTVEPETKKQIAPRTRTGGRIPASAYTVDETIFFLSSTVTQVVHVLMLVGAAYIIMVNRLRFASQDKGLPRSHS